MIKALDSLDRAIIHALAADSRISQRALAKRIGLSAPAAGDRVRRLQERGVIEGFMVEINPRALGYHLEAIVRIKPLPGKLRIVEQVLKNTPQITQCDMVTGDDCFIARLALKDIDDLDHILAPFHEISNTNSNIVKSRPVPRRLLPVGSTLEPSE